MRTDTFTTKGCGKVFKIQSGPWYSEKVLYILRCKVSDGTPSVGKAKADFCLRFDKHKSKHRSIRKEKQNVPQKHFYSRCVQDCHKGLDD